MVIGVVVVGVVLVVGGFSGWVIWVENLSCLVIKCVVLIFDDGLGFYIDWLLYILIDNDVKVIFFLIGNKVVVNFVGVWCIVDVGMEIGSYIWEYFNMIMILFEDIFG